MFASLKAEFRKLFTVRSTYVIVLLCAALLLFFAFYIPAFKASPSEVQAPDVLASQVRAAITFLSTLCAIVGVLLVTHEYRYNTVMYSLSSAKNRQRVIASKFIAVSVFSIVFAAVFGMASPALAKWGFGIHGLHLVPQTFPVWTLLWHAVLYGWGVSMLGLVFAFIIRIQVGALAALFLFPGTVEQFAGLLLKKNQVYLPFSSLNAVLNGSPVVHPGKAAIVAIAYIVVGAVVSMVLFQRRDAN